MKCGIFSGPTSVVRIIVALLCLALKVQGQPMDSIGVTNLNTPNPPFENGVRKLFYVRSITVVGNKHTRDYIIKRELLFKEKDSVVLNDLVNEFERSREQLVNTRLFNEVAIKLKGFHGYGVDIEVTVAERWYIFPVPYFNLVDRNFQAWADQGYSVSRINYGLKFIHFNTTGRKDPLNIFVISGYSKQLLLSYNQPYAFQSLKYGYGFSGGYNGVKEINVRTVDNKQLFLKSDSIEKAGTFLQENILAAFQFNYRPKLLTNHIFQFGYHWDKIDPTVLKVNPTYLTRDSASFVHYPEFGYIIKYVKADYAPYIQKGIIAEANLLRRGFTKDVGMWSLKAKATKAWQFKHNFSTSTNIGGAIKIPFDLPYTQQRLFGYGDFYLRGLEKYVIDGAAGAIIQQTLRKKVLDRHFRLPILSSTHEHIPFRIYLKTYADAGISYNRNSQFNPLDNKFLYTAGTGMDIVTLYDLVLRFECSVNQKGETGFFFHLKNDF